MTPPPSSRVTPSPSARPAYWPRLLATAPSHRGDSSPLFRRGAARREPRAKGAGDAAGSRGTAPARAAPPCTHYALPCSGREAASPCTIYYSLLQRAASAASATTLGPRSMTPPLPAATPPRSYAQAELARHQQLLSINRRGGGSERAARAADTRMHLRQGGAGPRGGGRISLKRPVGRSWHGAVLRPAEAQRGGVYAS